MECGKVVDWDYTGPVLEEVLKTHTTIHKVPNEGTYCGKAVVVSPIKTVNGKVVGAIGVVDLVAALDILSVFRERASIIEEVETARKQEIETWQFMELQTSKIEEVKTARKPQ